MAINKKNKKTIKPKNDINNKLNKKRTISKKKNKTKRNKKNNNKLNKTKLTKKNRQYGGMYPFKNYFNDTNIKVTAEIFLNLFKIYWDIYNSKRSSKSIFTKNIFVPTIYDESEYFIFTQLVNKLSKKKTIISVNAWLFEKHAFTELEKKKIYINNIHRFSEILKPDNLKKLLLTKVDDYTLYTKLYFINLDGSFPKAAIYYNKYYFELDIKYLCKFNEEEMDNFEKEILSFE